ncbi:MAG: Mrp/NBP35 family ATP-binding protein [Propionibacteriaceae bacterium]|nr:Mrp/NBP35 family ATP-binding protein [Propionibacteriaceae bacterium]
MTEPSVDRLTALRAALAQVFDPELGRPITDLGMVGDIAWADDGRVTVQLRLTTAICPLRDRLAADIEAAAATVDGVTGVTVETGVMDDQQRQGLRRSLGHGPARDIPFARPDSPTRVIAVASGKGGVGKSSITANLTCALTALGQSVGLIDADVYGHSIPDLLGAGPADGPTQLEDLGLVLPAELRGVKVMSIAMMKPERDQVVAWRGPIVSRSLEQFLTDVHWGDLDFLLIDLPPGTGDVALSVGQLLPRAEVVVVTTPQAAATEVAERAGTMAAMLRQPVIGVVENMSYLDYRCPDCGQTHRLDLFGSGGGQAVAQSLTRRLGHEVPLLAQIPLDPDWRQASDAGDPSALLNTSRPSAQAVKALAQRLIATRPAPAGAPISLAQPR